MCSECESEDFEECEYMCFERESEDEIGEYEYLDRSEEAPSHPTDEPGSFGLAKSVEDAKIATECLINVDYQIVSGRHPLVFHEESFGLHMYECFFEAPLVAGTLIEVVAAGAPAPATSSSLLPHRLASIWFPPACGEAYRSL